MLPLDLTTIYSSCGSLAPQAKIFMNRIEISLEKWCFEYQKRKNFACGAQIQIMGWKNTNTIWFTLFSKNLVFCPTQKSKLLGIYITGHIYRIGPFHSKNRDYWAYIYVYMLSDVCRLFEAKLGAAPAKKWWKLLESLVLISISPWIIRFVYILLTNNM